MKRWVVTAALYEDQPYFVGRYRFRWFAMWCAQLHVDLHPWRIAWVKKDSSKP